MARLAAFLVFASLLTDSWIAATSVKDRCEVCQGVVKRFEEGLKNTANANFGGGNTRWEEKSLGKWVTSETRFLDIFEGLCEDAGKQSICHMMTEAHEETLETWWFEEFPSQMSTEGLEKHLCIKEVKVCCPPKTYGPSCELCPGTAEAPCSKHGDCDGEGTRGGTGKCSCHTGYTGKICDVCKDGFYEVDPSEAYPACAACHESCESTCSEGGPKGCDDCKDGWAQSEEEGCQDVNECEEEEDSPCADDEYCSNTPGSYDCLECHKTCDKCTGPSGANCTVCSTGYSMDGMPDGVCADVNECDKAEESLCQAHATCVNTPGSYHCKCDEGFQAGEPVEGSDVRLCVPIPEEPAPKDETEESSSENNTPTADQTSPDPNASSSSSSSSSSPAAPDSDKKPESAGNSRKKPGKKKGGEATGGKSKKAGGSKPKAAPPPNLPESFDDPSAKPVPKRFRPIDTIIYIASILVFVVFSLVLQERTGPMCLFIGCFSVFLYVFFGQFKG